MSDNIPSDINCHDDDPEINLVYINQKLDLILLKLDNLNRRMDTIEKNVTKMDSHINFVESIYDSVKSPFHRVMNMITYTPSLPQIQ
jgi:hypothetical protein